LSSSTESKALRIGDPSPPVIPHLMRDLFRLDSRFHGNDTPLVILNRKQSASDWGSIFLFVIPHLMRDPDKKTGFPLLRE